MAQLPAQSIDAVITDPPYGCTYNTWDAPLDLDRFWLSVLRVLRPDGAVVVFSQQPFTSDLIASNRKWFRYELVWEKTCPTGFLDARLRPLRAHENVIVFAERLRSMTYNPQMSFGHAPYSTRVSGRRSTNYSGYGDSASQSDGRRHPRSVMRYGKPRVKDGHPTAKPIDLMRHLVRTFTHAGDTVLDPFAGGGSTIEACVLEGRRCIGMERDRRWITHLQKQFAA